MNLITNLQQTVAILANSYFFRLPKLWNALLIIDLSLSLNAIKSELILLLWLHFDNNFDSNDTCTLHFLCPCCNCNKLPHVSNFNHK